MGVIALLCFVMIGFGFYARQVPMVCGGAVGLCYVILELAGRPQGRLGNLENPA